MIADIKDLDTYFKVYGKTLSLKAVEALNPLHVPGVDPLVGFEQFLREPFPAQKNVIVATGKMMDEVGSGFVCGQMGTGKTIIGICAVHLHSKGKPYRAMVLCPDHLMSKWEREIKDTLPDVTVRRFDNWKGIVDLFDHRVAASFPDQVAHGNRWNTPLGPEWYVIGRDQSKWDPGWLGIGDKKPRYDGKVVDGGCAKAVRLAKEPAVDKNGRPILNDRGLQEMRSVIGQVYICPKCGGRVTEKQGNMASGEQLSTKKMTCKGKYLRQVIDAEAREKYDPKAAAAGKSPKWPNGLDVLSAETAKNKYGIVLDEREAGHRISTKDGRKFVVVECGEPLWHWVAKPKRWSPAKIIQKKCRKMFDYLVIDEVHEQKSDEAGRSMAAGKLMAAAKHVIGLTGTLIGGRADHLFPLMLRMTPRSLRREGFTWKKQLSFAKKYGRVDTIISTTNAEAGEVCTGKRQTSMRRVRSGGKTTKTERIQPGVHPDMFGNHMLGSSLFLELEDMVDGLPDLVEDITTGAVEMDAEQREEYTRINNLLDAANRDLLKRGSMKLLGATLATLNDYPDQPFDWFPEYPNRDAVGYYADPKNKVEEGWIGVVSPKDLDRTTIRPKEQVLIDICRREKSEGRQCWVYVQMTRTRDIQPRLQKLLEAEGLKVKILRPETAKPVDREDWINKNGPGTDVMISHPKLVETGLDLFRNGVNGHNFCTIIFYQTGYSLFTMRQAGARAWRIGQELECRTYFLYYLGTMQHRAVTLASKKMEAAVALEGRFSTEGLLALAGNTDEQMAMARAVVKNIDPADMQRHWGKIGGKKSKASASQTDDSTVHSTEGDAQPQPAQEALDVRASKRDRPATPTKNLKLILAPLTEVEPPPEIDAEDVFSELFGDDVFNWDDEDLGDDTPDVTEEDLEQYLASMEAK